METIRNAMSKLIKTAENKNYSRNAVEIIGAIACSETAVSLGYTPLESLKLATEYVNKYDNEKDCINALIEVIK